jgi:hypothetical protein
VTRAKGSDRVVNAIASVNNPDPAAETHSGLLAVRVRTSAKQAFLTRAEQAHTEPSAFHRRCLKWALATMPGDFR